MLHNIAAKAGVALGEPEDGDEDDDDEEEQGFQEDLPQNYVAGFDTRRMSLNIPVNTNPHHFAPHTPFAWSLGL